MKNDGHFKYQALEDWIKERISTGVFKVGSTIPSENELSKRFSCSRQTVRLALGKLTDEGLLEKKRGSGTFVSGWVPGITIGFVATNISDYIFPRVARGMENVLSECGGRVLFGSTKNQVDAERVILQDMLERGIDGLIVEGSRTSFPNPNLDIYREFEKRGIPYVFINAYYDELAPVHVVTDDRSGAEDAVRFLHRLGHERIGGIFKTDDQQGFKRYGGYCDTLRSLGLPVYDNDVVWFTTDGSADLFTDEDPCGLMARLKNCTAVVCYNDQIAKRMISMFMKQRVRVPQDISVVGFDCAPLSQAHPIQITSMRYPAEEIGREAANRILYMIRTGERAKSLVVKMDLVEKNSTMER